MRVTFRYKNGREKVMSEREADILEKLGHGSVGTSQSRPTYQTRDMQAAASVPAAAEPVESSVTLDEDADDDQEDKPKRRGRPPKVTQE